MIVIASSSFIVCNGLSSILKEMYVGKRIVCVSSAPELNKLLQQNSVALLLASPDMLVKTSKNLLKQLQLIKLIDNRPEYMETNPPNDEILYLDDEESAILRILKRNLALMDKNNDGSGKAETELSERELDIVREVALGKTNKEIADKLFISTHTVITHRKNITRKLGIKTVSGLTVYALLNKLIKMGDSL